MTTYFQSYNEYFWQWEDDGDVIAIPFSSTIAYKAFVLEALELMSPQGLPPFGSLLLTIIATNPQGESALNDVYALLDKKLDRMVNQQFGDSNQEKAILVDAFAFLKLLVHLPAKYKEGRNRLLLLQSLFAGCHNQLAASKAKHILEYYKSGKTNIVNTPSKALHSGAFTHDFRVVSLLHKRFPDNKIIIERLAALPGIETAIAIEEAEPGEDALKDFIEELTTHSKTFPVGSLIKRLWSGLNIPFHHYHPSQQPIGGVSDLTNKGTFDRLLISEYANDDIVFLSRLANNEALYINREVPPQQDDQERIILMDVSIKSWGTPRTIAFAILLAIARHPKSNFICKAFAVGNTYRPIPFETIDDIITSLEELDPCLHPAEGLTTFFKEYGALKNAEVFLVASEDSFRHPQVHKAISDHYALFNYWIQVGQEGSIDLFRRHQNIRKHVQHLQLPLDELWKREPAQQSNRESSDSISEYPILFPSPHNPKKVVAAPDGHFIMLTSEKHILRSFHKTLGHEKGWEMMYENVAYNNGEVAVGITTKGDYLFFLFNTADRKITIINIYTRESKSISFPDWRTSSNNHFLFYEGRFYYVNNNRYWAFQWGEQITVEKGQNPPSALLEDYKEMEAEKKKQQKYVSYIGGILKNVDFVFINQAGNLVLNKQELRIKDNAVIVMERTEFLKKEVEARRREKDTFAFPDGSTVIINRGGMLVLKSSDPSIPKIYVPSVLDTALGVSTTSDFAGNPYYLLLDRSRRSISNPQFFQQYLEPYIKTITAHGTTSKTN
ncbi:hypothetical protein [Flavisolibacter tropicus]|uniref:Uncharacterized protein n=1 Tax=Flavisolibacter tropicus TaxID=1492898 RepID=A0A172TQY6_9BACT|nr:hypothetical protein [Flavisolibacter tropicus]ANE49440.1 hypothetical protein SY85_01925 [Flavisolibacter tropicus]